MSHVIMSELVHKVVFEVAEPTPLKLDALGQNDVAESHHGTTWVWFRSIGRHGIDMEHLGLRIVEGKAKPCSGVRVTRAEQVSASVLAWQRVGDFLRDNPHLTLEDYT